MCGGGLAATALAYHYSTEVRRLVQENLPVFVPLLSTLDSYLDNINKHTEDKPASVEGDPRNFPFATSPLNLGAQKVR